MISIFRVPLALTFLTLSITPCHAQRIGVEVWMHGSDIETPKHAATKALRDSIEAAVGRSRDMRLSAANAGTVQITIPQDVIIASEGDVAYVMFTANISISKSEYRSDVSGYCRRDDLASCVDIVIAALRAVSITRHKRRLGPSSTTLDPRSLSRDR